MPIDIKSFDTRQSGGKQILINIERATGESLLTIVHPHTSRLLVPKPVSQCRQASGPAARLGSLRFGGGRTMVGEAQAERMPARPRARGAGDLRQLRKGGRTENVVSSST